ncbi:hypothetical protein L9F63_008674, partial [Diploptera punctata]
RNKFYSLKTGYKENNHEETTRKIVHKRWNIEQRSVFFLQKMLLILCGRARRA